MVHWSSAGSRPVPGRIATRTDERWGHGRPRAHSRPTPPRATRWPPRRFVRATQSDVWRLCAALGDRDSADDLTQETYLRAFGALHRFEGRSSVRTWLLAIARRVCADAVRPAGAAALTLVRDDADLEAMAGDRRRRHRRGGRAVADLLARLDPDRREAFVLTQLLGLPYAEAAVVAGCPVGTIRSRVARARARPGRPAGRRRRRAARRSQGRLRLPSPVCRTAT